MLPFALAGCPGPTDANDGDVWGWTALHESTREQRPVGTRVTYNCTPDGSFRIVWGTDIYTDDSSVCTAAVHAGKITRAQGGAVQFEIRPGLSSYQGSTRNGVTSLDWEIPWEGSFVFP